MSFYISPITSLPVLVKPATLHSSNHPILNHPNSKNPQHPSFSPQIYPPFHPRPNLLFPFTLPFLFFHITRRAFSLLSKLSWITPIPPVPHHDTLCLCFFAFALSKLHKWNGNPHLDVSFHWITPVGAKQRRNQENQEVSEREKTYESNPTPLHIKTGLTKDTVISLVPTEIRIDLCEFGRQDTRIQHLHAQHQFQTESIKIQRPINQLKESKWINRLDSKWMKRKPFPQNDPKWNDILAEKRQTKFRNRQLNYRKNIKQQAKAIVAKRHCML